MSTAKSLKIGIVVLTLASTLGCARLPSPAPREGLGAGEPIPVASSSVALAGETDNVTQASETSPAALSAEVTADLAPRREARAWLEATSKELEGTRTALLKVSAESPVTSINLILRFDPGQAEVRWFEFDSRIAPGAREVESAAGWRQYIIELSEPIQGEVTLGQLGYVAHGTARTTAAPPFRMETRFHHESGTPSVEER